METEVVDKLKSRIDRLNQRWSRALYREKLESKADSRKKLHEITHDQLSLAVHIFEGGNLNEASEYGEEVAHRAVGLGLRLPDLIKAFRLGKKLIVNQIFEAIPKSVPKLAKAIKEVENVYAAFEIAMARSHWRLDQAQFLEDSSKKIRQEEELRYLRRRMGDFERAGKTFSALGIQLMLLDSRRRVIWANRAARENFKEIGEVKGWTCGQVRGVPEGICDDCPTEWAIRNRVMERGMVSTNRGRQREFYEVIAFPILDDEGEVEQVLELIQDVTYRFKKSEERRQTEEYYRILFEHSGTAVCVLEPDKTISKVNRRFCQISGYSRDEIEGKISFLELVAQPERERMGRYHERRRVNPMGAPLSYEFTFVNKKGDERRAAITVGLVPGTMESICSIRDVTEEEQTKEFLEAVLYTSADAIVGLDENHNIVSWNIGAENLFGHRAKEIMDKPLSILWPEHGKIEDELERISQLVQKEGSISNYESEMSTRGGDHILVNLTISLLRDKLGKVRGYSVIVRDVTEQKALEQQVIHAEKLAAIGQLTAGLAHEMGTPLNIVSGRAEYLLADLPENNPRRESLQTIIHQTERMTKLIDNLLKFSRPQKVHYTKLELPEVMEGVLNLLETQLEKSFVTVDFRVDPDLPAIEADYNQLQQVFLNLILNSIQAMRSGGRLDLEAKPIDGRAVRIVISDTGSGIDPENLPRIFEPFFTTKDSGQGTGLGLAIVSKILRDHGGSIQADSGLGRGTIFTIQLPLSQKRIEEKTT